jgi:hypothetical protein
MTSLRGHACRIPAVEFLSGVVTGYGMKLTLLGTVVRGITFLGEKGDRRGWVGQEESGGV